MFNLLKFIQARSNLSNLGPKNYHFSLLYEVEYIIPRGCRKDLTLGERQFSIWHSGGNTFYFFTIRISVRSDKSRGRFRSLDIVNVTHWWLVRVTLVVDWLFLPQNFGPMVGTYEGLLQICECTLGGGSIFRWWGHLTTIRGNQTFSCRRWWGA